MKKWEILPEPPAQFILEHPELPPIITRLLWNRNLREQIQIDEFLNPDYLGDLHDPFLFNQMDEAVKIIFDAIKKQKNICVHGDYDADGVCAAAILITTLKKLGAKNVRVFIPHREIDGYGLNFHTVDYLKEQKVNLIITCDCGISNVEEVKKAKELGIETIITDHHTVPETLPPACAIIHPKVKDEKYPDKGLAGGAVAFKLVQGLLKKHKEKNQTLPDGEKHESYEKWMLDLVAIATIGDMVPLLGESRTLAKYGLVVLNKTRNLGLKALLRASGLSDENDKPKKAKFDAISVSFQIVPRLNAAGRMDHANTAYEILETTDLARAEELALGLNANNSNRQKLTDQVVLEAKKQIENSQKDNPVLFAYNENWPAGILGLVAGRLKDSYYKPAFALCKSEDVLVSSGRSINEFNIIEVMQTFPELFVKFGGHPQACGFSIKEENLEKFKEKISAVAKEKLTDLELVPQIKIDAVVDLEDVNWKLFDLLQKFEPFGQCNEEPKYAAMGLTVVNVSPVGQDGKHLRLMVKHNSHNIKKTIAFGFGDTTKHPSDWKNTLKTGDKIDLAFSVGVNEWNGNREIELKIEDIRRSAEK